jgi:hypothetical protein
LEPLLAATPATARASSAGASGIPIRPHPIKAQSATSLGRLIMANGCPHIGDPSPPKVLFFAGTLRRRQGLIAPWVKGAATNVSQRATGH